MRVECVIRSSHVSIGMFLCFFLSYCEALNERNVIHYGAGKLANVKETLNGVVGIECFGFYVTVRLPSAAVKWTKEEV